MKPYVITTASGLRYCALAASSCQALAEALALHGQQTITVRPLRTGGVQ